MICFHKPEEENGWLSNWYLSTFTVDGVQFSSMEQYMMYEKAVTFGDSVMAKQILAEDNVAKVKAYGRQVSNYDETVWNGVRQIVVYRGLLEKFSQDETLRNKLRATGGDVLAECAVSDSIWGIGLSMRSPDRLNMQRWRGQNLLGFALMQARDQL